MIRPEQDAYGQEVYDHYLGREAVEIIEREDGYVDVSMGPPAYFAPYEEWPSFEQETIGYARGRCLDVGCGPGRVCLHLQERGHDVVGIDNSPLAVKTAGLRGVRDARVMSVTKASRNTLGLFDTIVMFGNNFGLFGSRKRARWLLRRFHRMTSAGGRILAATRDICQTEDEHHLEYQASNRARGRMSGQMRLRVLYRRMKGPWFDYLMVSPSEMREIADGTGWRVAQVITEPDVSAYTAVLKRVR